MAKERNVRNIKRIFIHCSAGYGNVESIKRYWKSIGWKSVGYHRIIDLKGNVSDLASYFQVTNGVKSYNNTSIHICYIGGVEYNNINKAMDTRTQAQKDALICEIHNALNFLKDYQDISDIQILGHRDISPDKNLNGKVDSWERIKECPSFDAKIEYKNIK
jgi:N-acetylmuramoyl-L-alanine amidase